MTVVWKCFHSENSSNVSRIRQADKFENKTINCRFHFFFLEKLRHVSIHYRDSIVFEKLRFKDGQVWTVEIKLRSQISSALSGRRLQYCASCDLIKPPYFSHSGLHSISLDSCSWSRPSSCYMYRHDDKESWHSYLQLANKIKMLLRFACKTYLPEVGKLLPWPGLYS